MLQMIRNEPIGQLTNMSIDNVNSETTVLERLLCPYLTNRAYKGAVKNGGKLLRPSL